MILEDLKILMNEQAEDEGLWFVAKTAPEAYLQHHLRRLHDAIEKTYICNVCDDRGFICVPGDSVPCPNCEDRRLRDCLEELREYFDQRADADQPSGSSPIPNEEMTLLMQIDEVLKFLYVKKGSDDE